MDQHPIPRQITTFEFKLIGFMTLKQFIYLVIFVSLGYVVYKIFPVPILNVLFGIIVAAMGLALAFLPINDRPLDVWIRNLVKRLTSPTQYVYLKHNDPIYFLKNLFFMSDPHHVMAHIESQEKLASYLAKTKVGVKPKIGNQNISQLLQKQNVSMGTQKKVPVPVKTSVVPVSENNHKPFFSGVIKNHKLIPIPGILIYIKDEGGRVVRLLKTNPYGVFATFNKLPLSDYTFEFKDPRNSYSFDTMKIKVEEVNSKPLEFYSKELL